MVSLMLAITTAEAASYADTYNPDDMLLGTGAGQTSSHSWEFDITTSGFNPLTQNAISGFVDLQLRDDKGPQDGTERLSFSIGGANLTNNANANKDMQFNLFDQSDILLQLSDVGKLLVVLTAIQGDFIFEAATLHVAATDADVNSVPLPAALWLFGSALLGLIGATRGKSVVAQA